MTIANRGPAPNAFAVCSVCETVTEDDNPVRYRRIVEQVMCTDCYRDWLYCETKGNVPQ